MNNFNDTTLNIYSSQKKDVKMSIPLLVIVILAAIVGATSVAFLGKDNAVEQISEEIIEKETGVKVDFSDEDL